jgi:hypothetical protein
MGVLGLRLSFGDLAHLEAARKAAALLGCSSIAWLDHGGPPESDRVSTHDSLCNSGIGGLRCAGTKRPLLHLQEKSERQGQSHGRGHKDPPKRSRELCWVACHTEQLWRPLIPTRGDPHEDRSEHRHDQRTTKLTKEVCHTRCGPKFVECDGVLECVRGRASGGDLFIGWRYPADGPAGDLTDHQSR